MSFEEVLEMVFQPGMSEIFCLALSFCLLAGFSLLLLFALAELVTALIHRYIWPGKKSQDDKK